jgi:hypothetical protein
MVMIIDKLETMEKIVKKYKNLIWDGWNVIDLKQTEAAKTSKNGIRVKNVWYLYRTYTPDRTGWKIPDKYKV